MPQLSMSQNMKVTQRQELTMTPQQMQGLEILQMANLELEQHLTQQLVQNPVLELENFGPEILEGDLTKEEPHSQDGREAPSEDDDIDKYCETLDLATPKELPEKRKEKDSPSEDDISENHFLDNYTSETSHAFRNTDAEEKWNYFLDSVQSEKSMTEVLHEEIHDFANGDEKLSKLCEDILGNIDDNGYLQASDDDLNSQTGAGLSNIQKAVKLLQSMDPPGFAARDLRECLLLQLDRKGRKDSLAWKIVDEALDELGRNHLPQLARKFSVPLSAINKSRAEIQSLSPRPASAVLSDTAPVIAPDVYIEQNDDGLWTERLNRDIVPTIVMNPQYVKMVDDPKTSEEDKQSLRKYISDGKQLLWALNQRMSTIEKISAVIVERQQDFLQYGDKGLKPMILAQVAEKLGLHEATISRAIANKYVRTPRGTYPFKHFFSTGYVRDDGEKLSSRAIKEKILEFIHHENPEKPLSDQALSNELKKAGLKVARRTVAKYREAENILAASLRRAHK